MILLFLLGCGDWFGAGTADAGEEEDSADSGNEAGDTELAADDARVRALTDLPEGDYPCLDPMLVRIAYITDGDTVYVHPADGSAGRKVRFIGIDTPEIAHDDPAECFGDEATAFTSDQLLGRLAWLTFDRECFDPYDRSLAYLIRDAGEGGFFNRVLAREGYAAQLSIEPNTTYASEISVDVAAAQRDNAGMWEACP
jgi:micrococcal nuclease